MIGAGVYGRVVVVEEMLVFEAARAGRVACQAARAAVGIGGTAGAVRTGAGR